MVAAHFNAKTLKRLKKFGNGMKKFRDIGEGIFNFAKPLLGAFGPVGGAIAAGGDALFGLSHIGDNAKSYNRGYSGIQRGYEKRQRRPQVQELEEGDDEEGGEYNEGLYTTQ
jgi:hypothetical protein